MFRAMRLKDQQLDEDRVSEILNTCTNGVLSVKGDNGYPYGVPLSYAYADGKIYFHCSKEGYKVELLKADPKVSFTVISQDNIIPEAYNTLYVSVIAFGTVRLIDDPEEMRKTHIHIVKKYSKGYEKGGMEYLDAAMDKINMAEITIDHITGTAGC